MYQYTEFDQQFVKLRAQQFRDQLERWQRGELTDEQLLPLRLQNGWYIQRYAPMARIAVPYGEISSRQLRMLAHIARDYDKPTPELLAGSLPGIWLGTRLVSRTPERLIRSALSLLLAWAGAKLVLI